jgi:hypothetical protein
MTALVSFFIISWNTTRPGPAIGIKTRKRIPPKAPQRKAKCRVFVVKAISQGSILLKTDQASSEQSCEGNNSGFTLGFSQNDLSLPPISLSISVNLLL